MQPISTSDDRGQAARRLEWSDLHGEEFAADKSASVPVAELLTVMVGGTSRRNVLGAIAWKRSIATSRSDDNRDEDKTANHSSDDPPEAAGKLPKRYRCANDPMETVLA